MDIRVEHHGSLVLLRPATDEGRAWDTIIIEPHGPCDIVIEHGREWAVCNPCGAQWALQGADLEQITEGDGSCEEVN